MPSDSERKVKVYKIKPLKWVDLYYYKQLAHTAFGRIDVASETHDAGSKRWWAKLIRNETQEYLHQQVCKSMKQAKKKAESWYRQQLRKALTEVKP